MIVGTGATLGDEEYIEISGQEALWATYEDRSKDQGGWVALVLAYNQLYMFQTIINPADTVGDYADITDAMFESIEIFRPR